MRSIAAVAALSALALSAAGGEVKRNLEDEGALATLAAQFAVAWNHHDPKAMTAFFTPDADLINPFGREAKGAAEIQKLFEDEHTSFMKDSRFKATVRPVQWIRPDVTVTTWDVSIQGMLGPDGKSLTRDLIVTSVIVKAKEGKLERWLCAAARAMALLPSPAAK